MYKVSTFWEGGCLQTEGKLIIVVAAAGALAQTQAKPRRSSLGSQGSLSRLRYRGQIFFFNISTAIYSAYWMARDTIVKVGFSAPPVVNWLSSEMYRFLTS